MSSYPEPIRSQLQDQLRGYLDYIIHEAWPLQWKGQVPAGGVELMNRFQKALIDFEPATEGQRILHAEALHAYNEMIQSPRLRLDVVGTHLPGILWLIIFAGALIGISSSFFFRIEDARVHAIQVVLLTAFIGLVIFMTVALDRPFCGDLGLGLEAYQLVYEHLIRDPAAARKSGWARIGEGLRGRNGTSWRGDCSTKGGGSTTGITSGRGRPGAC